MNSSPLRYLLAFDSFKGSLPSLDVAKYFGQGLAEACPQGEIKALPLADGGEGTLIAFQAIGGEWCHDVIPVAAGMEKEVRYLLQRVDRRIVMEVAQCVGIEDLIDQSPKVMERSSFPFGHQMLRALQEPLVDEIYIGLGGSCTSDGGLGLLEALGLVAFDATGAPIQLRPVDFPKVVRIEWDRPSVIDQKNIVILSDVENPLCGPKGACHVFGPQKGLEPHETIPLDREISRLYEMIETITKHPVQQALGAGAAGGLGAALLSLGAECRSGAEVLFQAMDLDHHLRWCDVIVTGEGRSDHQTLSGKCPARLANRAKLMKKPCHLVSGSYDPDTDVFKELTLLFKTMSSLAPGPIELKKAMDLTPQLLWQAGYNFGKR